MMKRQLLWILLYLLLSLQAGAQPKTFKSIETDLNPQTVKALAPEKVIEPKVADIPLVNPKPIVFDKIDSQPTALKAAQPQPLDATTSVQQAEKGQQSALDVSKSANAAVEDNKPVYSGKKISLDFQDIEIRRVLQLLASYTGVNLVAADSVQGNITLHLKDLPWDQALDLMLKSKGLAKRHQGNAIWIAPMAELSKVEAEEAQAQAQHLKSAVLHTVYLQLKYAKASDIQKLIQQSKQNLDDHQAVEVKKKSTEQQDEAWGSLLSYRGSIAVDQRTNTLVLMDSAEKLEQISKMIALLDVPVRQVMIEARVIRASTDFTKELGVKWGAMTKGSNNGLLSSNLNIDLGVSGAGASKIAFGLINLTDAVLDLELSALQADGSAEVISTPKVLTADKQKANVAAGRQVPYQTRENTGGVATTSTSFKDALLSLEVTPSITPDGRVQMQLQITSDSPGEIAPNGEFILNKNQINTNVLVKNGETVVLGGIFEQDSRHTKTKVPVFGNLPAIGGLFRRTEKIDKKSELLIFVTPRIVNDSLLINH